jgi:hypothetical protein
MAAEHLPVRYGRIKSWGEKIMSQNTRLAIVVGVLVLVAAILALVGFASQSQTAQAPKTTPQPGMIHLSVDGAFVANLAPADLQKLPAASFVDKEQGKTQGGWWLRDVVRNYVKESSLSPQSKIVITGSRQGTPKNSTLTWAQLLDPANNILFNQGNDGSIKIASTMAGLDTRDTWVQGLTEIAVQTKP